MTWSVIINADDFGLTDGVTRGIVEAMAQGVVSSTTAMTCVDGAQQRVTALRSQCRGRVGLHLQLTAGVPCRHPDEIPSLVGDDGCFPASSSGLGDPQPDDILLEWQAQIERLRHWGIEPSHLDSHHHVHMLPQILPSFEQIAKTHDLPVRSGSAALARRLRQAGLRCPDEFLNLTSRTSPQLDEVLRRLMSSLRLSGPNAVVEIGCHPGIVDDELRRVSTYVAIREHEWQFLCMPAFRTELEARRIRLVSFEALL